MTLRNKKMIENEVKNRFKKKLKCVDKEVKECIRVK